MLLRVYPISSRWETVNFYEKAGRTKNANTNSSFVIAPTWISSTTDYNDYQPTPMGKEDAASYLEKLTQRSNEIKTNFDVEKVYGE